jgi:hypothetical protein
MEPALAILLLLLAAVVAVVMASKLYRCRPR